MPVPPWLLTLRRRLGIVTLSTLAVCVAMQLVFGVAINLLHSQAALRLYLEGFALSGGTLAEARVWQLITYGMVHDLHDPFHVVFNALAIYWFMSPYERLQGSTRTLRLLLVAVGLGGVLQLLWTQFNTQMLGGAESSVTVGVSAAVVAFVAAYGWQNPSARVQLFFVVPLEARWLAAVGLGVDFLLFVSGSRVAFFAHVGGWLAAWFLIWGRADPQYIWRRLRGKRARRFALVN